jgi:pimeloyl-ACP methyl ester carboxylesterase
MLTQADLPPTRQVTIPAARLAAPAAVDVHTAVWDAEGAPSDAPVQVAVHGLGASYLNWLHLAPRLRAHGPVWAPDLIGFGRTPLQGRTASIDDNLELLVAFIRTVSPERKVVLLGNSMGGLLSLLTSARHPELVAGLVLIDPAMPRPFPPQLPDPLVALNFGLYMLPVAGPAYLRARQRRMTPRRQAEMLLELCGVDLEHVSEVYLEAAAGLVAERRGMAHTHPAFLQAARSVLRHTLLGARAFWRAADLVAAPTLLVHGGRDRLVPIASARALAGRRPDWDARFYPDLGHTPLIEDPERVAADIAAWRAEHLPRRDVPAGRSGTR